MSRTTGHQDPPICSFFLGREMQTIEGGNELFVSRESPIIACECVHIQCVWVNHSRRGFLYISLGKKISKKLSVVFLFFSFRKKYFKKLLLEFFYKIICIGISHEHTAASNTPIIFLLLQYLDLCTFHYVIRRVSSQLKFDSLTE